VKKAYKFLSVGFASLMLIQDLIIGILKVENKRIATVFIVTNIHKVKRQS